jgi:hypothetical protein
MRSTARLTNAVRSHKKAVTYAGAAAALLGVGTAGAATISSAAHSSAAPPAVTRTAPANHSDVSLSPVSQKAVADAVAAAQDAVKNAAAHAAPAPAKKAAPAKQATAVKHAAPVTQAAPVKQAAPVGLAAPEKQAAPAKNAPAAKPAAPVKKTTAVSPTAPAAKPASATTAGVATAKTAAPKAETWAQIEQAVAKQTASVEPKAADQLQPVGTAGPQAWMPISGAQLANATTIVRQALEKGMGVRSAVIAVATSMQESQLQNINYGDRDSLGLFQQRPSSGWGTPAQVTNPRYAADAFLSALAKHQASDPTWVHQPLWSSAQSVQNSGFPFAYAKWETQAAHLVKNIVTQVK